MTESLPPTTPAAPTAGAGDKAPVSTGPKPLGASPMGARPGGRPSFGGPRSGPGGPRSGPGGRPTGPGGRGRRPPPRRKVCRFCVDKIDDINYKDVRLLAAFISERGKIVPRRISGVCAPHQRRLSDSIKQARNIALLPFAGSPTAPLAPTPGYPATGREYLMREPREPREPRAPREPRGAAPAPPPPS